jgi:hypothetical protein
LTTFYSPSASPSWGDDIRKKFLLDTPKIEPVVDSLMSIYRVDVSGSTEDTKRPVIKPGKEVQKWGRGIRARDSMEGDIETGEFAAVEDDITFDVSTTSSAEEEESCISYVAKKPRITSADLTRFSQIFSNMRSMTNTERLPPAPFYKIQISYSERPE